MYSGTVCLYRELANAGLLSGVGDERNQIDNCYNGCKPDSCPHAHFVSRRIAEVSVLNISVVVHQNIPSVPNGLTRFRGRYGTDWMNRERGDSSSDEAKTSETYSLPKLPRRKEKLFSDVHAQIQKASGANQHLRGGDLDVFETVDGAHTEAYRDMRDDIFEFLETPVR